MKTKSHFSFFRFALIVGTLLVMMLLFNNWFFPLIFSVGCWIVGDEGVGATYVAIILANLLAGGITILPLYWEMRENAEERRAFLAYFADHEYNRKEVNAYIRSTKTALYDTVIFVIALVVVLLFEYLQYALQAPIYWLIMALAFAEIFGIFALFEYFVRRKLYKKWESERLRK